MSTELEKALEKAKYAALPLPRARTGPTTVFAFTDGHLYIVRNPHTCLPNPPLEVTPDPAVDTLTFTREFRFEFKGIVGFLIKLFGMGNANAELGARSIRSATIQLGGLAHHTIQTGALIDYLMQQDAKSPCVRDILDRNNFTVLAALRATTFGYTFRNERGVVVKFSGPEASRMFKVDANVQVDVTDEGNVVVNASCYIGVVTWDGGKIAAQLKKAQSFSGRRTLTGFHAASALENAIEPSQLRARWLKSMKVQSSSQGP